MERARPSTLEELAAQRPAGFGAGSDAGSGDVVFSPEKEMDDWDVESLRSAVSAERERLNSPKQPRSRRQTGSDSPTRQVRSLFNAAKSPVRSRSAAPRASSASFAGQAGARPSTASGNFREWLPPLDEHGHQVVAFGVSADRFNTPRTRAREKGMNPGEDTGHRGADGKLPAVPVVPHPKEQLHPSDNQEALRALKGRSKAVDMEPIAAVMQAAATLEVELKAVTDGMPSRYDRIKLERMKLNDAESDVYLLKSRVKDIHVHPEWIAIMEKVNFQRAFNRIDIDSDGKLSGSEVYRCLRALHMHTSRVACDAMIWEVDEDMNGSLEISELARVYYRTTHDRTGNEPRHVFCLFEFVCFAEIPKRHRGHQTKEERAALAAEEAKLSKPQQLSHIRLQSHMATRMCRARYGGSGKSGGEDERMPTATLNYLRDMDLNEVAMTFAEFVASPLALSVPEWVAASI